MDRGSKRTPAAATGGPQRSYRWPLIVLICVLCLAALAVELRVEDSVTRSSAGMVTWARQARVVYVVLRGSGALRATWHAVSLEQLSDGMQLC